MRYTTSATGTRSERSESGLFRTAALLAASLKAVHPRVGPIPCRSFLQLKNSPRILACLSGRVHANPPPLKSSSHGASERERTWARVHHGQTCQGNLHLATEIAACLSPSGTCKHRRQGPICKHRAVYGTVDGACHHSWRRVACSPVGSEALLPTFCLLIRVAEPGSMRPSVQPLFTDDQH